MNRSRPAQRLSAAIVLGIGAVLLASTVALAHPESEGDHPSGCVVIVEPGSVAVGGQFTVSGNFGGASIFLVEGADASPAEGAEPDATTPEGSSFSVTFTAEASDVGTWTVWGLLPESECGDADDLTVTAAPPNTAMDAPSGIAALGLMLLLVGGAVASVRAGRQPE
jgi:hypothetical protein